MNHDLKNAPLGKKSLYKNTYTPSLLFSIPRKMKRDEIGIGDRLPFQGIDIWNAFEISWLNPKGKPRVAMAEFQIPCDTPNLIESKSFKLYLNSFNNSHFEGLDRVQAVMKEDLSHYAGKEIGVKLFELRDVPSKIGKFSGICLDDLDIECSHYLPQINYLSADGNVVEETLFSDLLKSNCLVTGQPDWGSIQISYRGKKINHEGLLRYIVSLRDHEEFHEQCVERIFNDILRLCEPQWLTVYARYTRRGGLDINPYRTNQSMKPEMINDRLIRQ